MISIEIISPYFSRFSDENLRFFLTIYDIIGGLSFPLNAYFRSPLNVPPPLAEKLQVPPYFDHFDRFDTEGTDTWNSLSAEG